MLINNLGGGVSLVDYVKQFNPSCLRILKKYRTSKLLNLHKKYRSDFEIMALMLEVMKDGGAPRFSIMKYTSVNSAQLKKYLGFLIQMGFVEMDMKVSRVLYRSTERGLAFLRHYYVLLGMLLSARIQDAPQALFAKQSNTSDRQQYPITQIVTHLQRTP
jgi:predicted transcriptional regulator